MDDEGEHLLEVVKEPGLRSATVLGDSKYTGRLKKPTEQAGAELCQAQEKLGLAKPALPVVVFHLL